MDKKRNVPEIRFAGFTDDWEQRELNHFLEVSKKINSDNLYNKHDVLSVSGEFGVVNQIEFQGRSFAGASVSNYGVVETGDVVYTKSPLKSNPYGIIKTNKCNPGIVSTLYAVYKPKKHTDPNFVQVYFEYNQRLNGYLYPLVSKGAKNDMKISDEKALSGLVYFPRKDEQTAIGNFFKQLDETIALHQREYEKYKNLKISYLEKMFPKENEQFPELRFPEFTDAWEQRKLGEIGKAVSGIGFPDREQQGKNGIPFYKVSDMNNIGNEIIMDNANNYVTQQQILNNGWKPISSIPAIIFAKVGAALMLNRKRLVLKDFLIDNNTMAYIFNDSWHCYFGKTLFDTIHLPKLSQIGALPSFNVSDLESLEIKRPKDIKEQTAIGNFFKQLDETIALHQREVEKYKQIKQSYLEKMFI